MAKPVRLTLFVDNDQLKRAFNEAGDSADKFGRNIEQHSSKVGTAAVAMGAFVAGAALQIVDKLGEVAIAAIKFLPELGEQFDAVNDRIRIAVGDNPILNGEVQATFRALLPQVASPMEDVGQVVTTLAQRLGLTGDAAIVVGAQILDLTRMTGGDLGANTQAIAQAFDLWGVSAEQMPGLLDFLFRTSQESGASIATLTEQLDGSSLSLKSLGFSLEDVITSAGGLDRAGIAIGDIDQALKRLIKNNPGKDLAGVFDEYVRGIQDGSITSEQALVDLGARGGNAFFQLAQSGKLNFADLRASIDGGTDSIKNAATATEDWPEKWEKAKNRILLAIEPIATGVFEKAGEIMGVLFPTDANGTPTGEVNVAGAWDMVAAEWEKAWPKIEPVLADLWKKFTDWWGSESTQKTLSDIGNTLAEAIFKGFGQAFMNLFSLDNLLSMLKSGWIGQGFQDWLDEAAGGAKTVGPAPGPVPFLQPQEESFLTRAVGGPVSAGMPYVVGEHRREWFVPKVDGVISNKAPMTSGGGDTFNIVAPSPQTAAMEIIRQRRKQSYLAGVA